jgi:hypothetical protein
MKASAKDNNSKRSLKDIVVVANQKPDDISNNTSSNRADVFTIMIQS